MRPLGKMYFSIQESVIGLVECDRRADRAPRSPTSRPCTPPRRPERGSTGGFLGRPSVWMVGVLTFPSWAANPVAVSFPFYNDDVTIRGSNKKAQPPRPDAALKERKRTRGAATYGSLLPHQRRVRGVRGHRRRTPPPPARPHPVRPSLRVRGRFRAGLVPLRRTA